MWWLFRQDHEQFVARGPYASEQEARQAVSTGWVVSEGDTQEAATIRALDVLRRSVRLEPPEA
jgi:hypothetical protein